MSQSSHMSRKRERALRRERRHPSADIRRAELVMVGRNGYVTRYTPRSRALRGNLVSIPDIRVIRRKKRLSDALPNILITVCLVFATICVLAMGTHQESLAQSNDDMHTVAETMTTTPQSVDETNLPPAVDFAALQQINPEVAGWIYIPGTNVNYPIMSSTDQEKYLRRDMWGRHTTPGSIFTDAQNSPDLTDEHVVLYGHHLPWESMFTPVSRYLTDVGFLEQHRTIYIETPTDTYVLSVIGTHKVQPTQTDEVTVNFQDDLAFQQLVDEKLAADRNAGKDTGDYDRSTIGKLFSLITCADNGKARSVTECIPVSEYPTSMIAQVRESAGAQQTEASASAEDVSSVAAISDEPVTDVSDAMADSQSDTTDGQDDGANGNEGDSERPTDTVTQQDNNGSGTTGGIDGMLATVRQWMSNLIAWLNQVTYDASTE